MIHDMKLLLGATLAVGLAVGAATASRFASMPRTLAYADGPIAAFAEDATSLGWVTDRQCLQVVRVRDLVRGVQKGIGTAGEGDCRYRHDTTLALAGTRALWTHRESGNENYVYGETATLGGGKARIVAQPVWDMSKWGIGDHFGGSSGHGRALVFALVRVSVKGPTDCDLSDTCIPYVSGGGLRRVVGNGSVKVPGAPPAVAVDTDGTRVALLPAGVGGPVPRAAAGAKVEIRNAKTGKLLAMLTPGAGTVRALAIGGRVVYVLVTRAGASRLERFASRGGQLLSTVRLPAGTAPELDASASYAVFRTGNVIHALGELQGAGSTVVATAKSTPIGLAISGKRVAWAENLRLGGRLRGRIEALALP